MDVVVWSFLIFLAWIAGLTVLFPLTMTLTVFKTIRRMWFSWFFVEIFAPLFLNVASAPFRRRLFRFLEDGSRANRASLEVLEIGIGDGANLKYYPDNVNLTVLDVNENFMKYFARNIKKYTHVKYKRAVIQNAADMSEIEDASMDVVVSTYLHCYCCDSDAVLREVLRVLKPGGKYLFLEHVCFPKTEFLGWMLQKIIRPLWYVYGGGCVLDRDIATFVERAAFSDVVCENFEYQGLLYYIAKHHIVGMATKGTLLFTIQ